MSTNKVFWENQCGTQVQETTFDRSIVGKLSRRIHLPPDLYAETHEERFLTPEILATLEHPMRSTTSEAINIWRKNYNHRTGWGVVWLDSITACKQSRQVEVILRRHPRAGNFILFRTWKDGNQ